MSASFFNYTIAVSLAEILGRYSRETRAAFFLEFAALLDRL